MTSTIYTSVYVHQLHQQCHKCPHTCITTGVALTTETSSQAELSWHAYYHINQCCNAGLDEQGKAHHEPKHAQQLDIKVKDLKANDRFRLYFSDEKETATVPGAPPGAKLVPGATVTLHYPVPVGSKPVYEIQRLCGDDFSDTVKVLQAHKPSNRCRLYVLTVNLKCCSALCCAGHLWD